MAALTAASPTLTKLNNKDGNQTAIRTREVRTLVLWDSICSHGFLLAPSYCITMVMAHSNHFRVVLCLSCLTFGI